MKVLRMILGGQPARLEPPVMSPLPICSKKELDFSVNQSAKEP
jgi:hypothetical protein